MNLERVNNSRIKQSGYQPTKVEDAVWIPLTRRMFALVDEQDAKAVLKFNWQANKKKTDNTYYAFCYTRLYKNKYGTLPLHKFIANRMGLENSEHIDHEDGNGLNCRRTNLRDATSSQNHANMGLSVANTSGFKGVSKCKQTNKWRAAITVNGKFINLGRYINITDAVSAYDKAALKYFKNFARTNAKINSN